MQKREVTIPIQNISESESKLSISERLNNIRETVQTEYCKRHTQPWIIAYSGGKDSTLLLQIVIEVMLSLPPEQRKRQVHIVSNDTLVESPLVIDHLRSNMELIRKSIHKLSLPITATITTPCIDQTFWANVIGRGYIPPTRNFRWCTDRMKINPTTTYIAQIATKRPTVLLIGTRKSESQNRRRNMEKHGVTATKMNKHGSVPNCRVFAPIADLTDDDVWIILMQCKPPWGGGDHTENSLPCTAMRVVANVH